MKQCTTRGCSGTATKDSTLCYSCEERGFQALLRAIHGQPYPAPKTPPAEMHAQVMAIAKKGVTP